MPTIVLLWIKRLLLLLLRYLLTTGAWLHWGLGQTINHSSIKNIHATCRACLLTLEPRLQARRMENMLTRQLLTAGNHFFATDDADITNCFQFFNRGIRISREDMKL